MTTLRRLAHSPAVTTWRTELLVGAALAGGLVGMLTGAY